VRLEILRSIEKSNNLINNRTRGLPACSTAPRPTTLPRVPVGRGEEETEKERKKGEEAEYVKE
jgi:hypothetical protein